MLLVTDFIRIEQNILDLPVFRTIAIFSILCLLISFVGLLIKGIVTGNTSESKETVKPQTRGAAKKLSSECEESYPSLEDLPSFAVEVFLKVQSYMENKELWRIKSFVTEEAIASIDSAVEYIAGDTYTVVRDSVDVLKVSSVVEYEEEGYSVFEIQITASLLSYVIDDENSLVAGSDTELITLVDTLVFKRKMGIKVRTSLSNLTTHCPNCGAPYTRESFEVCSYCDCKLNDGDYNWVLTEWEE